MTLRNFVVKHDVTKHHNMMSKSKFADANECKIFQGKFDFYACVDAHRRARKRIYHDGNPRDRFFYQSLTLIKYSYNPLEQLIAFFWFCHDAAKMALLSASRLRGIYWKWT